MICSISENEPLNRLLSDVNLPPRCHGWRKHCVHGFAAVSGNVILGLPGTALGYCQALFSKAGSPANHTQTVINWLERIQAPWSRSHELFWGHRRSDQAIASFLQESIQPLVGSGRVPILISSLDPASDGDVFEAITRTRPAIPENESVLLRVVLKNEVSIRRIVGSMKRAVGDSYITESIPSWWPLLQGAMEDGGWERLQKLLGSEWRYANVAVNPFISDQEFETVAPQVTVAQIPIGLADGMSDDGTIRLPRGMKIHGAKENDTYSLFDYVRKLSTLPSPPTLIVLGPSAPGWTNEMNAARIERLLPLLRRSCDLLWHMLPTERRDQVWKMAA
jgi:hypothetical protein